MRLGAPSIRLFVVKLRPRRAWLRFTGDSPLQDIQWSLPFRGVDPLTCFRGRYQGAELTLAVKNTPHIVRCIRGESVGPKRLLVQRPKV